VKHTFSSIVCLQNVVEYKPGFGNYIAVLGAWWADSTYVRARFTDICGPADSSNSSNTYRQGLISSIKGKVKKKYFPGRMFPCFPARLIEQRCF
jgi:hypothetical protein